MKITIGEIFKEFHSGDSIKAKEIGETGLYPVFGGNGLRGFTSTYNVDGEFVFIGRQGAYCGNTRYYNGKAFLTEHAIIAIPNEGFNAKYLEYKLDRANLYQFQAQAAQPGLSVSTLKRVKIDIADSSVQQKIGLLLSIIDRKIALNKQINCDLEAMAKQLYDYWFVQFDFPNAEGKPYKSSGGKMVWNETLKREIPEGWIGNDISVIAEILSGGTPSKAKTDFWNGDIPFFGPTDCNGNTFQTQTAEKITEKGLVNCSSLKYEVGTIIITARGSIGKCIIAAVPMAMNQSCYALHAKKENRVPYLYFITKQLIEHLKVKGAGSVFKSIIASDIKSSNLAIGNDSVVDSFCCMTSPMFEAIKNNTIEIDNLTAQRDSLLPLLMNGQVTIKQ